MKIFNSKKNKNKLMNLPKIDEILKSRIKFRSSVWNYDINFFYNHLVNKSRSWKIIIPKYQRNDIWSLEQKEQLIRAILYWVPIPPVILNKRKEPEIIDYSDVNFFVKLYLVDWWQRLRTLKQFFENKLVVDWFTWDSLWEYWRQSFLNKPLQSINTNFDTEDEEKIYYKLFNTSWISHTERDF